MRGKYLFFVCVLLLALGASSCATQVRVKRTPGKTGTLPPGQLKKVTGSRSAEPYAPGHRK